MIFKLVEDYEGSLDIEENYDLRQQLEELYSPIPLEEAGSEFAYTTREFEKILQFNGYTLSRSNGDHNIYTKPGKNPIALMVGHKTPNAMVLRRLIKENGLEIPKKLRKK